MCLYTIYSCFQSTIADLNSPKKDHMTHKAENTYFLAIYQKFVIPWPKTWSIFMNVQYVLRKKKVTFQLLGKGFHIHSPNQIC